MRQILTALYKFSGAVAALCILSIAAVVFAQVCLNLVDKLAKLTTGQAIGLTIPSYADFTGFLLAAATFLGLAYALRAGGHIRVTLVTGLLGPAPRRWVEALVLAVALGMAGYATVYMGLLVAESHEYGDMTSGMVALPLWLVQLPVAIGLGVLSIALLDDLIAVLRGAAPSYEGKGENLLSE